ncbi:carbon-nitrogen hydrolase family protein [Rhodalgimonas zhirmunskyi]|uniref:Carbon-nitrogen hydrolase family protein n=1 Tax=Rhodalgimonas zhirmunskyi TaxID=2964767 RepID=A0AAJ1X8R3_9RHOB|nr:carbon-nitrogen hydrolase family protein [Rhodoalgimonas zhirmunskyi]MDQ2095917.1 carbon-nitrogen hydrolase family protein [Rhodoalgimonas zhirmunskyi]
MKIATAAYPPTWLDNWGAYEEKLSAWVSDAAEQGAELLVFPEYGAMELASLSGEQAAGSVQGSIEAVGEWLPKANALYATLAQEHGVHILSPSAPVRDGARTVNRTGLFTPDGKVGWQDKQIMTRFERDDWGVEGGGPLQIFDTTLGKIGVLICYDSEFPLLGKALADAGAEIILVPSATEAEEGYSRVRIGAMARALELQCVTVMASLVGEEPRLYAVEENRGRGGIFGPPDRGFPPSGVISEGVMDAPGWTYADVDLEAIRAVRADGRVLNLTHWAEQAPRVGQVSHSQLT